MPLRAMMVWQSFTNFGSWMAIGAWLLVAGGVVGLLFALASTGAVTAKAPWLAKAQRPLAVLACVLGLCIAAYTGILLSVLVAHPLWNTPLLPILFTISAVDTGVALTCAYAAVREKEGPARSRLTGILEQCTVVLVAAEAVVLVALLAMVGADGDVGALSVATLATGVLAVPFWVLFVAIGLVLPLVVAVVSVRAAKSESRDAGKTKLAVTGTAAATAAAPEAAAAAAAATQADGEPAVTPAVTVGAKAGLAKAQWVTLAGAAGCLVGGCALRFLILLAGLPVWA